MEWEKIMAEKKKRKSIWCKLGLHKWSYATWIHYGYWGPYEHFAKKCRRKGCELYKEIYPYSHQINKFRERSIDLKSTSSC